MKTGENFQTLLVEYQEAFEDYSNRECYPGENYREQIEKVCFPILFQLAKLDLSISTVCFEFSCFSHSGHLLAASICLEEDVIMILKKCFFDSNHTNELIIFSFFKKKEHFLSGFDELKDIIDGWLEYKLESVNN